jgi:hypothetical protein
MPIAYKNFLANNVTSNTVVYNPTANGIQSTVIGLIICNNSTVSNAMANVTMYAGANTANIVVGVSIPVGTSLSVIDSNRLIVAANNIVTVTATSSVDVILSAIEVT